MTAIPNPPREYSHSTISVESHSLSKLWFRPALPRITFTPNLDCLMDHRPVQALESLGCHKVSIGSFEQFQKVVESEGITQVDCLLCDPFGQWVHCWFTPENLVERSFKRGLPFDGSSIRLFCTVDESDMLMVPDLSTAFLDPFEPRDGRGGKILHLICRAKDPATDEWYSRDPRTIAVAAVDFMKSTGLADDAVFSPVAEFFVFDHVQYHTGTNSASFMVDTSEGYWNSNAKRSNGASPGNLGMRTGPTQWYLSGPPMDSLFHIRTEMATTLKRLGVNVQKHHHEIATSQCSMTFQASTLVNSADQFMMLKHVARNIAAKHGKSASFLPKPIYGDHGSGLHVHQSLWKNGKPLFFGDGPAGLSITGLFYIGGLLRHAAALTAFTNPTTNSYKRLVPGFEAPVNLVYSAGNRSAAIRIPAYYPNDPSVKRIEFRVPDPTCNAYIAFAAQLMAGLDGIINKIHPGNPLDMDVYELSADDKENLAVTPASLGDALSALEADHDFLLEGGVFSKDFLEAYISYKRVELARLETAPHPLEFEMYYNL